MKKAKERTEEEVLAENIGRLKRLIFRHGYVVAATSLDTRGMNIVTVKQAIRAWQNFEAKGVYNVV